MTEVRTSTIFEIFKGSNRGLAPRLIEIVTGLMEHWPLTVRQVYYQAVGKQLCENSQNAYAGISRVLTKLRENELLPWDAFTDRSRRVIEKRGLSNLQTFVSKQQEQFLNPQYYHRCYVQNQSIYVEVTTEKDALSTILEEAIWYFCTRLVVVRGQCSTTVVEQMARRYGKAIMHGLHPVMVHFGDLDPTGVGAPKSIVQRLKDVHGIEVDYVRAALNPDQPKRYELPPNLTEAKTKDPNYKAWLGEFGPRQSTFECDALHPADLKSKLKQTLVGIYDMASMKDEMEAEEYDRRQLKLMRNDVRLFMRERYPELRDGMAH